MAARSSDLRPVVAPGLWRVRRIWVAQASWILAAGAVGFGVAAIGSSLLELGRDGFVLLHAIVTLTFFSAYVHTNDIDVSAVLRYRWVRGIIGGVILATLLALSVQRMDASPQSHGGQFAFDVLWLGVIYGVVDALLLSILPVLAVWKASRSLGHADSWNGKIVTALVAVAASMFVTAAYHLGFAEFRDSGIREPLIGNTLVTLGYILSSNPVTAIIGHVALHIASVVHGVDATVTLPPH